MTLNKSLNYLRQLTVNNNREWYHANKDIFIDAKAEFENFVSLIIGEIRSLDNSIEHIEPKDCIFRIYKDVRFSKDKTPYKINFGAYISNGGRKSPFAGYYMHLEPEASFIGGGIYMPQSENLRLIRQGIIDNADEYKNIINNTNFKDIFGGVYGEKLKSAPRGFSKNLPEIELIKNKHYAVIHNVNDNFWLDKNLITNIKNIFETQKTFNDFLNSLI